MAWVEEEDMVCTSRGRVPLIGGADRFRDKRVAREREYVDGRSRLEQLKSCLRRNYPKKTFRPRISKGEATRSVTRFSCTSTYTTARSGSPMTLSSL